MAARFRIPLPSMAIKTQLPRLLSLSPLSTKHRYSTMSLPTKQRVWVVAHPNPTQVSASIFALEERPLPAPADDEVLVSADYLSNDPVTRLSFNAQGSTPTVAAVGTVLAASGRWQAGDRVSGRLPWADCAVVPAASLAPAPEVAGKPWAALSDLGSTAITAYAGVDVLDVRAADVVLVGGASGAVGAAFVQMAKHVRGAARVVGVAGGRDKCRWVEGLGADACVDYRSASFAADLARALPDGASAFLDPVGGAVLNAALANMQKGGRVAVCGNVAALNGGTQTIDKPLTIVQKGLTLKGFSVMGWLPRAPQIREEIAAWIAAGKIRTDADVVVDGPVDQIPATYTRLYDGTKRPGKLITHVTH